MGRFKDSALAFNYIWCNKYNVKMSFFETNKYKNMMLRLTHYTTHTVSTSQTSQT